MFVLLCGDVDPSMQALAEPPDARLGRAGWEAIQAGRITEAARSFQEAIAANPKEATFFLGAGLAAHLQRQEAEARAALEEALRLNPKLTAAALLLGEIAFRGADLEAAIKTYEEALKVAPDHAQIRTRLERWRKEAALHGGFQQALSPHFTVLFEGPAEQQVAAAAIDLLEAAYWRIGTTLLAYPSDIITVILYTVEQFRDVTRSPAWAAGLFDGKIRVPMRGALNDPRQLEKVLAHEFTHALVNSLAPRGVPVWLNEGLAVAFEPGDLAWARRLVRQAPARIPLAQLEGTFQNLPPEQVPLAYAESALAVQMLLERGGPLSLATLFSDLAEGQSFGTAFARRFFLSFGEFQTAWEERVR